MREIKFRAWVERYKKYIPVRSMFFETISGKLDYINVMATGGKHLMLYPGEFILEQYTGLEDRGKEIYDGDIIRWANSVGREITAPVVWNTRAWCWTAGDYMLGGLLEFDLEVVGNIHEDLKLLEAKQ